MKRSFFFLILILLTFTLISCGKRREVDASFYYWKSTFQLSPKQLESLRSFKTGRMYVKFYDVVWKGAAVPDAEIRFQTKPPAYLDVVPTVFIANSALNLLPGDQADVLAEKICAKTLRMARINLSRPIAEIQLDCDWNQSTREKYFRVLRGVRQRLAIEKIKLSATIRLHQIKYRSQTGAPPVDRGMLMAYNVEPVQELQTVNSIFNPAVVKDYLQNINGYPLPLDVALPIFSWGVVFQGDRFIGLVNNLGTEDLRDRKTFLTRCKGLYNVLKDTDAKGVRLYHGDTVRLENAAPREVRSVIKYLRRKLNSGRIHVAIYHFDDLAVRRTGYATIQRYFSAFAF